MEEAKETGRIEAFSDGVFAIAITLLVLELKIEPGEGDLFSAIISQWGMFLAFFISFATIGIMWINHHRLFTLIRHSDHVLLLLNLLLLLMIVLVPFPTALLSEYGQSTTAQHNPTFLRDAAALYSGTFIFIAIFFNALWRYATYKNRLLGKNVDPRAVATVSQQYLLGPLLYLLAFVVAFFSVPLCLIINGLLALFFAIPGKPIGGAPQAKSQAREEGRLEEV